VKSVVTCGGFLNIIVAPENSLARNFLNVKDCFVPMTLPLYVLSNPLRFICGLPEKEFVQVFPWGEQVEYCIRRLVSSSPNLPSLSSWSSLPIHFVAVSHLWPIVDKLNWPHVALTAAVNY